MEDSSLPPSVRPSITKEGGGANANRKGALVSAHENGSCLHREIP